MNRLLIIGLRTVVLIVGLRADDPARVLIVVGPSTHPPRSHEVAAGGRLLKHCLENMTNISDVDVTLVDDWPTDASRLNAIDIKASPRSIRPPQSRRPLHRLRSHVVRPTR